MGDVFRELEFEAPVPPADSMRLRDKCRQADLPAIVLDSLEYEIGRMDGIKTRFAEKIYWLRT